jgi:hypothetical protein
LLAYTDIDMAACRKACNRRALRFVSPSPGHRLTESAPMPAAPPDPQARKTLRIGLTIDVVGFGSRSTTGRESVEHRLLALLSQILADAGTSLDQVDHRWHGDGASVYLPSDVNPPQILTDLTGATARRLAEDNQRHADRIRLRMAVTLGLLGHSTTGYTGPLVVDLARMIDAPPLRQAITDKPDRDLAVLTSDHVYSIVVQPGHSELPAAAFRRVEVAVKEFAAPAWLWMPE